MEYIYELYVVTKRDAMKRIRKDNGHTLIEMVLVAGLIGVLMFLLWTNYLSIHRTYIKAGKKAQNLEEARLIVTHIQDTFQKYESKGCTIIIYETGAVLEDEEEGTVKQIVFGKDSENIKIAYDRNQKKVTFQTVEIGNEISDFTVKRSGPLLDFTIQIEKKGNNVVQDQVIQIETIVTLEYIKELP